MLSVAHHCQPDKCERKHVSLRLLPFHFHYFTAMPSQAFIRLGADVKRTHTHIIICIHLVFCGLIQTLINVERND
jgi:hypothetical protein